VLGTPKSSHRRACNGAYSFVFVVMRSAFESVHVLHALLEVPVEVHEQRKAQLLMCVQNEGFGRVTEVDVSPSGLAVFPKHFYSRMPSSVIYSILCISPFISVLPYPTFLLSVVISSLHRSAFGTSCDHHALYDSGV
jgi:hypothetical protein